MSNKNQRDAQLSGWLTFGTLVLIGHLTGSLVYAQATAELRPAGETEVHARRVLPTQINKGLTDLDRYIDAPDDTYSWKTVGKKTIAGVSVYVIDLKSQTWRSKADVDRTVWQHWLTVLVPKDAKADTALMIIDGGSNGKAPPTRPDLMAAQVAIKTKSIVASIGQIPNQPLTFHDDGKPRKEDDLIAYTWDQYLKSGDSSWAARMLMTKAVVLSLIHI